jgi:hypothetical protein
LRSRKQRRTAPAAPSCRALRPNEPVPDSFSFDKPGPQWYKHAVFYEVWSRVSRLQRRRDRRSARPHLAARYPVAGYRLRLVARLRLPLRDAGMTSQISRQSCPTSARSVTSSASRGSAQARHPDYRRPGHEPHQRSSTRGSGVRSDLTAVRRLLHVVGHRRQVPDARIILSTPSSRTGRSTRCAASTTGTGSSITSPT